MSKLLDELRDQTNNNYDTFSSVSHSLKRSLAMYVDAKKRGDKERAIRIVGEIESWVTWLKDDIKLTTSWEK